LRTTEDNASLGDKDSIRRRALMALEGNSELGSFSTMALPDLGTPEPAKPEFSFCTFSHRACLLPARSWTFRSDDQVVPPAQLEWRH
jgi:hypothetical protein